MMISRMMLSLRKSAHSQENGWSFGGPSVDSRNLPSLKFFSPPGVTSSSSEGGDIPLYSYSESQVTTQ